MWKTSSFLGLEKMFNPDNFMIVSEARNTNGKKTVFKNKKVFLKLEFKTSFTGNRHIYVYVRKNSIILHFFGD